MNLSVSVESFENNPCLLGELLRHLFWGSKPGFFLPREKYLTNVEVLPDCEDLSDEDNPIIWHRARLGEIYCQWTSDGDYTLIFSFPTLREKMLFNPDAKKDHNWRWKE